MKKIILVLIFVLFGLSFTDVSAQTIGDVIKDDLNKQLALEENKIPGKAVVLIYSNTEWSGMTSDGDMTTESKEGYGYARYVVSCGKMGLVQGYAQKQTEGGWVAVVIIQNGNVLKSGSTNASYGVVHVSAECSSLGGCLIATATHGTELAPQVQMLREIRDNVLFGTSSGTVFMAGFNEFYYSFSPAIADLERQSPIFREIIKMTITPMLSTLSILQFVEIDSEQEILSYGIGIILLNVTLYFVVPTLIIMKLRRRISNLIN